MISVYARFTGGEFHWLPRLLVAEDRDGTFDTSGSVAVLSIDVVAQWGAYDVPASQSLDHPPFEMFQFKSGTVLSHPAYFPSWYGITSGTLDDNVPHVGVGPYPVPPDDGQIDMFSRMAILPAEASPRGLSDRIHMRLRRLIG